MTWIQTFTGKAFRLSAIEVDLVDIAHQLSMRCRFNGACNPFYSVAEHSVRMSHMASALGYSEDVQKWCLFHDSAEAYLPDVPRPFKLMGVTIDGNDFKNWEWQILMVVAKKFGLRYNSHVDDPLFSEVGKLKDLDDRFLATEKRDLMSECNKKWAPLPEPFRDEIIPWHWADAKHRFLARWEVLNGR